MEEERTESDDSSMLIDGGNTSSPPPLVGFYYQRNRSSYVFTAIPSNFPPPDISSTGKLPRTGNVTHKTPSGDTLAVINSSNGLLLFYSSKPVLCYLVHNPISLDRVLVRLSYDFTIVAQRFMVHGFAFDPYPAANSPPYFTIVEVCDVVGHKLRVMAYSSSVSPQSPSWVATYHKFPAYVRDDCALSGPSTFYKGNLHWLLEPSGVVAYHISTKSISFSLTHIPGDENYLDANGFCHCMKKMRSADMYSNGDCSCRYLGESKDQLVYVRVTGNTRFKMWTLVDYSAGIWSPTGDIVVDNLHASLYFGRVLAFDRMEPHILFLRVGKKIFSYSCIAGELKEICRIMKDYGGEKNCLGVIVPYELPRISVSIPSANPICPSDPKGIRRQDYNKVFAVTFKAVKLLLADPAKVEAIAKPTEKKCWDMAKSVACTLTDDNRLRLYNPYGISQVALKYFPHLQPVGIDAAGPPVWSSYKFYAPFTIVGIRDTVYDYNDFHRVEACLYGCIAHRELKCVSSGQLKRLPEVPALERYQASDVSLLGFFHQRSPGMFLFTAIPSNFSPDISTGKLSPAGMQSQCLVDGTLAVLNSSNGLLLLYSSKPTPQYMIYNPIASDKVLVRPSCLLENVAERFMVFGFAFNPYCTNPYFTIVEVTDCTPRNCLRVNVYSSHSLSGWETIFHKVPAYVGDNYALSGQSTFYKGALHWLLEPFGIVAYNIRARTISFSLTNILDDEYFVDENGLCGCVKRLRDAGLYSSGHCSCRYLGISGDQLIYVRVAGGSVLSLYILEDYCRGVWSHPKRIVVDNLPTSLFFGSVLAFDRVNPRLLYLRVKKNIFSYSCDNEELKLLFEISKDYGGQENCLGFIIPYELPRIPLSIPHDSSSGMLPEDDKYFAHMCNALKLLQEDPSAVTDYMETHPLQKDFLEKARAVGRCLYGDDGLLRLYRQFGISQVAVKCFPRLQLPAAFDATGSPSWSSYDFSASLTIEGVRDAVVKYNDFVRVEASLYGCTAERYGQNSEQLLQSV